MKTNMDLDQLVIFLLRAEGGGSFTLDIAGTDARIDVKAFTNDGGSYNSSISQEILLVAAEQCRAALKARYPELR